MKKFSSIFMVAVAALSLTACGPSEEEAAAMEAEMNAKANELLEGLGESMEAATEEAAESTEEMAEGAMEEAAEEMEGAMEEATDASEEMMEEATDAATEAVGDAMGN